MPSTFTTSLGLEKPATGEQAGSWGTTANFNYDIIDAAINGGVTVSLASSPAVLQTNITGAGPPAQGVNRVITCTGAQLSAGVLQISPSSVPKVYIVRDQTTGGFGITIQQGSGASVSLQAGYSAMVYCDGTGPTANVSLALDNPQFSSLLVTGNVTVQGSITAVGGIDYGTGSSHLVQIHQSVGIGIGLAPAHSLVIGDAASPEIWLDSTPSTTQARQIIFSTSGSPRWGLQTPLVAESGSNVGSDLQWVSFDDSGNPLRVALFLARASGNVMIGTVDQSQPARLKVVGDNSGVTVLGVRAAAGQTVPVLLCQDATPQNLMAVDPSGNLRIAGAFAVQVGPTLYTGVTQIYHLMGADNQPHAFSFAGGILVSVV